MHGKAVEREQRLKEKLQAARAKLKELRQRLRERWARRRGSEKRTRSAGGIGPWGGPGNAQFIRIDPATGALIGGSDPRRDGYAVGF